jgi:DNA-binding transcriptional MerR regulator
MAAAGVLEYTLVMNTKNGTVGIKDATGKMVDFGNKSERAAQRASKGIRKLFNDMMSLNQAIELAKKVWNLLRGPIEDLMEKASSAGEINSKFLAVFKDQAPQATKFINQLSKDVKRSRTDLKDWMGTLQDTLVPLGFSRIKAREFSQTLVKLGIDLGSFNNKAEPEVMADLQSAIVGNVETMRKYGVIITQATLHQELLTMGVRKGVQAATEAEKAQARLNIIMKGTTDAQGDAIRTANEWANSTRGVKAIFEQLKILAGEKLIDTLTPYLQGLALAIDNNMEKLEAFAKKVGDTLGAIFNYIAGLGKKLLPVFEAIIEAFKPLFNIFMSILPVINGIITVIAVLAKNVIMFAGAIFKAVDALKPVIISFLLVFAVSKLTAVIILIKSMAAATFLWATSTYAVAGGLIKVQAGSMAAAAGIRLLNIAMKAVPLAIFIMMALKAKDKLKELIKVQDEQIASLNRGTDTQKLSIDKYRAFRDEVGLTREQLKQLKEPFMHIADEGIRNQKILQAIAAGRFGEKMKKQFEEWIKGVKEAKKRQEDLTKGVVRHDEEMAQLRRTIFNYTNIELKDHIEQLIAKEKLTEKEGKEIEKYKTAMEGLASKMQVLTREGYAKQNQEIQSLLLIYGNFKDQIFSNTQTTELWIKKLTHLSANASPALKAAIEAVLKKLREMYVVMIPTSSQDTIMDYMTKNVMESLPTLERGLSEFSGMFKYSMQEVKKEIIDTGTNLIKLGIISSKDGDKWAKNTLNNTRQLSKFRVELKDTWGQAIKAGEKFAETQKEIKNLGDAFTYAGQKAGLIIDQLIKLGFIGDSLGGILKGMTSGVSGIGAGITAWGEANNKSGILGFLGKAGAGLSVVTGAISIAMPLIKGFLSLFKGDGVGEAIRRETQTWMNITDDMEKRIREMEKQYGNTHAAMSMMMGEILKDAEITVRNFGDVATRVKEIFIDYERGVISYAELQESMGQSWTVLLENAKRLGTEGSFEMLSIIRHMRENALDIAEINDYINENLQKNASALTDYLSTFQSTAAIRDEIADLTKELNDQNITAEKAAKIQDLIRQKQEELNLATQDVTKNWNFMQNAALATMRALKAEGYTTLEIIGMMGESLSYLTQMAAENGLEMSAGLAALTDMSEFINQNQELVKRIDATRIMMESLANADFFPFEDFQMFSNQVLDQYNQIIAQTGDQEMALRLIAPTLADIIKYSEAYGYTIDANTQALIDQATEQGLLHEEGKTQGEITNEILLAIAEVLGATIPEHLRNLASEVETSVGAARSQTQSWQLDLDGIAQTIRRDIPDAAKEMDEEWEKRISGNTVLKENRKWFKSLLVILQATKEIGEKVGELDVSWQDSLDSVNWKIYSVVDVVDILGEKYVQVFNEMTGVTEDLFLGTDGVIRNLYQVLALQGQAQASSLSGGIGNKYGLYSDEEKIKMTQRFWGLSHLYDQNRKHMLSDPKRMADFLKELQGLQGGIMDDAMPVYQHLLTIITKNLKSIEDKVLTPDTLDVLFGTPDIKAATGHSRWLTQPTNILLDTGETILAGEGGEPEMLAIIPQSRFMPAAQTPRPAYAPNITVSQPSIQGSQPVHEEHYHITINVTNPQRDVIPECITAIKENKHGFIKVIKEAAKG